MQNKKIIKGANLRFLGSCGIYSYLKLVAYLLNKNKILAQLYINFSRQERQIDVLYVSFNA